MKKIDDCTGIVLAGGQSKRMGSEKSSLYLGVSTMLAHSADFLEKLFPEVLAVVNREPQVPVPNLKTIYDRIPDQGPLRGLEAALMASPKPWIFVIGVDMPLIRPEHVLFLAGHRKDQDIVMFRRQGKLEPLFAFYSRDCLTAIQKALHKKQRQLIAFFPEIRLKSIDVEEVKEYPELDACLTNVNSPEDFARLKDELEGIKG